MKLPVPSQARLLQGLLGLTLLLVVVCGVQEKPQRPAAQPGNPLRKAQEQNVEAGEDPQLEGISLLPDEAEIWGPIFLDGHEVTPEDEKEAHRKVPGNSDPNEEEDEDEEEARMSSGGQQGLDSRVSVTRKGPSGDTCEASVSCWSFNLVLYANILNQELPNCPCTYPDNNQGVISLFDKLQEVQFDWRDASSPRELPHNSSASSCLRSMMSVRSSVLASQHCCYDAQGRLLTWGDGVGTPDLISPDLTDDLLLALKHLPWSQCKEEWVQHRDIMPPNNGLSCPENPPKEQTPSQLQDNIEA